MADPNMAAVTTCNTGGGTGIGFIIAKAFAANGAKVYITGRRLDVLEKPATSVTSFSNLELHCPVSDRRFS
ncbi:uncharacterized protein ARMOST_22446 [Armillaria ostoyae]|uniref:Uncharacterized protein n=1 Tax=Armillaria ostoyae TaxID=47428 RepID=A0A284SCV8_ARMOS|nr:uncharacterized protein ARMOST_22446 [Armillaria ostoyae]